MHIIITSLKSYINKPSGCHISSISTSFLFRLLVFAASYLPVICCCFIMVKTLYKSYITGILAILLGPPPLFFFPFPRRAPLPLPKKYLEKKNNFRNKHFKKILKIVNFLKNNTFFAFWSPHQCGSINSIFLCFFFFDNQSLKLKIQLQVVICQIGWFFH